MTGLSHVTSWGYDTEGRVTSKTNAAGSEMLRYKYNGNGWLTNQWSAEKLNTYFTYDDIGDVTFVNYNVSPDLTYNYDALGRLSAMVSAAGTNVFLYDGIGQMLYEAGPFDLNYVSSSYTRRRRDVLAVQRPNQSWWTQFHGYDSAGRLTSLNSPAGNIAYTLGGAGGASSLIKKIVYPNGSYITNTYDSVARLTGTYLNNSVNGTLNSHTYGYNAANLRTSLTNLAGNFWTYGYDNANQLKSAVGKESGGTSRLQEQFGYGYDASANLSFRTNNALVQAFTVNVLNGLSNVTRSGTLTVAGTTTTNASSVTVNGTSASRYTDATFAATGFNPTNTIYTAIASDVQGRLDTNSITVSTPSPVSFTYDANGNMTSDGSLSYGYDDENQLIRITATNQWGTGFTYDGKMRLRVRSESNWIGSAWVKVSETRYIYDGMLVVQERDGNNVPLVTYTRGRDLSGSLQGAGGIGGLLARTDNTLVDVGAANASAYYHSDGNGSVTALVSDKQLLAAKYAYDPYGNILSQSGPLGDANSYRFSSKDIHRNSGRYYYGYRFYAPNFQRWLNRDPLGDPAALVLLTERFNTNPNPSTSEISEVVQRMRDPVGSFLKVNGNLFRMAGNNPINFIDPRGLDWIDCMGRCIDQNDPLGNGGKGALSGAGGTVPYRWARAAKLCGKKLGTPLTTLPSIVSENIGMGPGNWLRGVGRFFSPIWVTYGLYLAGVEAACAGQCTGDSSSY